MATAGGARVGEWKVQIYLYDLSQGMAKALSMGFLGKQIDGIWHTGLVVYGHEYYYGGGIQACRPGGSMAGQPMQVIDMGYTRIAPDTFHEFLNGVSHRFTAATYDLLQWNCNNFTNEAALFLLGKPIPAFITGLPAEALATPFGQMLRPMIDQMQAQMRSSGGGMVPWGSSDLQLPRTQGMQPDRMVDAASNPTVPHGVVEAAAALAAQAIQQTTPSNLPAATPASPSSASSSSSPLTRLLGRSSPARPLTSADRKSRSFHILLKSAAKKADPAGLTQDQDAAVSKLVAALDSADGSSPVAASSLDLLGSFLSSWPPAAHFPVLGLLRLVVLRPECAARVEQQAEEWLRRLEKEVAPAAAAAGREEVPANAQAMALCSMANLLSLPPLAKLALHPSVWSSVRSSLSSSNLTVRLMSATLCFNACVLAPKGDQDEVVEACTALVEAVKGEQAVEVAQRLLLALGELVIGNAALAELLVGLEFPDALQEVRKRFDAQQVQVTCDEIGQMLKQAQDTAFSVQ